MLFTKISIEHKNELQYIKRIFDAAYPEGGGGSCD